MTKTYEVLVKYYEAMRINIEVDSEDKIDDWRSEYPNLDIRRRLTLTIPKLSLDQFVHKPTGWKQATIDEVPGWNIRKMFKL